MAVISQHASQIRAAVHGMRRVDRLKSRDPIWLGVRVL
jgi:hypothetical protein